jgi:putative methyltransferase (TIGR04325 family)
MPRDLDPHRWLKPDAIALSGAILRRGVRFVGSYPNWEAAAKHASGYDEASILQRASEATKAVRDGRAAFDRDGVTFGEPYYPYPLIAGLLDAALRADGVLSVIDFGGALGSTYFQCRRWLQGARSIRWSVVEQDHYVDVGRQRYETLELKFERSISDCLKHGPTVVVFSSVLQYLDDPWKVLEEAVSAGLHSVLIARTPVIEADDSIITVQQVPASIVSSSYPTRLFTKEDLLRPFHEYRLVDEHEDGQDRSILSHGQFVRFKGYTLTRD